MVSEIVLKSRSLKPSGLLKGTASSNRFNYVEPLDSARPEQGAVSANIISLAKDEKVWNLENLSHFVIGNSTNCDIVLDDNDEPKEHAVLQWRGTGDEFPLLYLMDLESPTGTLLNGQTIPSARYVQLKNGDEIEVGRKEFLVSIIMEDE